MSDTHGLSGNSSGSPAHTCGRVLPSPRRSRKWSGPGKQTENLTRKIKKERVCRTAAAAAEINFEKPTTFSEVVVERDESRDKLPPLISGHSREDPDDDLRHLGINGRSTA
jgi:hypothetical protein